MGRLPLPPDDPRVCRARMLWLADVPRAIIARRMGVAQSTIQDWRATFGWPRRRTAEQPKRRPARPTRWRCGCARLNTDTPCACGHMPPWAEEVA